MSETMMELGMINAILLTHPAATYAKSMRGKDMKMREHFFGSPVGNNYELVSGQDRLQQK